MKTKYEIIQVNQAEIIVDVSLLSKTEELFFNATQMAKPFGRRPDDFWKQSQNQEYLDALITLSQGNYTKENFIHTKRGKFGGTYFHNNLALQFARWLSPIFGVKLDRWTMDRIKAESDWQRNRLEAKTGFLPMTDAILRQHDPAKHYHFRNEIDLINRIVLGMPAKQFKKENQVNNVRDACTAAQLQEIDKLQLINTGLIEIGKDYQERKEHLISYHEQGQGNLPVDDSQMKVQKTISARPVSYHSETRNQQFLSAERA
ncbi:KilA-N domain-containing protein [Desulfotignum balticum]|uniref:KilA-N domain-containing protein n=1 Tax=Desulfotignum balticum TaxID=115781 RepID=UPI0004049351|nr:KilA-N domain-containing protein [Desulfotignum balticum]